MADNSSNSVASVAIVIILIAAAFGIYYFINHGGLKQNTSTESTKIEVNMPKADEAKPAQ